MVQFGRLYNLYIKMKKNYKQTKDHIKRRAESRIKNAVEKTGLNYIERKIKFRKENVTLRIFQGMVARSKNRFTQTISLVDFREFMKNTPSICAYCDRDVITNNPDRKQTLSIDRKYNEIGYVQGNICISCYRCNTVKGDVFTYDEMREIAQKYLKNKAV